MIAALQGDRATAERYSREIEPAGDRWSFGEHTVWRASIAGGLGDAERAIELMRQAFDEGLFHHQGLHIQIGLESLAKHPAYRAMMRPKE